MVYGLTLNPIEHSQTGGKINYCVNYSMLQTQRLTAVRNTNVNGEILCVEKGMHVFVVLFTGDSCKF